MKLRTFHPERAANRGQEFHAFLKEAFTQIKEAGVEHLILDIRDNNGGSDVMVGEVLSYLLSDPFSVYKQMSTITNTIPNHEYYQGDMAELEQWAQETLIPSDNRYLLPDGEATQIWQPKALSYEGELYILTNARTYSAAGDFCGIIKQHQRGQFIGEEPGGNGNCNTAGLTLTLILPNSGIRAHIPTVRFELAVDFENIGYGVFPDYEVLPTLRDFLEDQDPVLDFVKKHISAEEY
jgi:C-terminal processing protease CtpA/Prc